MRPRFRRRNARRAGISPSSLQGGGRKREEDKSRIQVLIKGGRKEKEGEIASLENKRRKRKRRDNIETINFSFSLLLCTGETGVAGREALALEDMLH